MAGRRRTGALAGALDLAGALFLKRREEERSRRERAQALALKFDEALALLQLKRGQSAINPYTGEAMTAIPSEVPSGLEPSHYTDPATGTRYARPPRPRQLSPVQQSQADVFSARQAILAGQRLPHDVFLPEARQQLIPRVSSVNMVPGPTGTFVMGGEGTEVMPGFGISPDVAESIRGQMVNQQAPALATMLRSNLLSGLEADLAARRETMGIVSPKEPSSTELIRQLMLEGGQPTTTTLNEATQSVIEDLQNGSATKEEFLENERELQQRGVDTQAVRMALGI